jgi:hypothetical protein
MGFDPKTLFGEAVADFVSIGVKNDGGGIVVVNGHVIHVDPGPGDPVLKLAVALAAVHAATLVNNREAGAEVSRVLASMR